MFGLEELGGVQRLTKMGFKFKDTSSDDERNGDLSTTDLLGQGSRLRGPVAISNFLLPMFIFPGKLLPQPQSSGWLSICSQCRNA